MVIEREFALETTLISDDVNEFVCQLNRRLLKVVTNNRTTTTGTLVQQVPDRSQEILCSDRCPDELDHRCLQNAQGQRPQGPGAHRL